MDMNATQMNAWAAQCSPIDVVACRAVLATHTGDGPGVNGELVNTGAMQRGKQAWGHDKASK